MNILGAEYSIFCAVLSSIFLLCLFMQIVSNSVFPNLSSLRPLCKSHRKENHEFLWGIIYKPLKLALSPHCALLSIWILSKVFVECNGYYPADGCPDKASNSFADAIYHETEPSLLFWSICMQSYPASFSLPPANSPKHSTHLGSVDFSGCSALISPLSLRNKPLFPNLYACFQHFHLCTSQTKAQALEEHTEAIAPWIIWLPEKPAFILFFLSCEEKVENMSQAALSVGVFAVPETTVLKWANCIIHLSRHYHKTHCSQWPCQPQPSEKSLGISRRKVLWAPPHSLS